MRSLTYRPVIPHTTFVSPIDDGPGMYESNCMGTPNVVGCFNLFLPGDSQLENFYWSFGAYNFFVQLNVR